jgi:type IX secretion system substrate protein
MRSMTRFASILFILGTPALWPGTTSAQFSQQGSKLVGTGVVNGANDSYQGASVSISSDGNTAIVGGWVDSSEAGAAWVYTRTGGVWSQQGNKLVGTGAAGNARQGFSVSISGDGNTAIVGGYMDNSFTGAAWIYTRAGGVWTQQGGKLVGTGAVGHANQGVSVSLSSDGNTAVVGGDFDDSLAGAAWIYTRTGGVWSPQGSKLVGTGVAGHAQQGLSVSLSSDGNTVIIGGYADSGDVGAAWVFTRTGGVWSQQGSKLVGTGAVGSARQGVSVSLSSDGNTAIVGGAADSSLAGAAWVYTRTGGVWSQQGGKLVGTGAVGIAAQGNSVSLSSEGNTAIVGGYLENNFTGAAWVYTRTGGVWSQQGSKLVGTGAAGNAEQGYSVSLSSDGSTALVGGYADNNFRGAAWVYVRVVSSVRDVGGEVPLQFGLGQNYPNPFNPSSMITFQIPNFGHVRLTVFDLLGEEIKVLVNEELNPGSYETKFDGGGLSSGVYFYRLQTGKFVTTRKLLLQK